MTGTLAAAPTQRPWAAPMLRWSRIALALAGMLTFTMAALPHPPPLLGAAPDKLQHIAAFAVLAALSAVAFPARPMFVLLCALIGFGALIEVVQAIPALNRDSDILDLLADAAAALLAGGATRWWMNRRQG